jgi:hypothetical protein
MPSPGEGKLHTILGVNETFWGVHLNERLHAVYAADKQQ